MVNESRKQCDVRQITPACGMNTQTIGSLVRDPCRGRWRINESSCVNHKVRKPCSFAGKRCVVGASSAKPVSPLNTEGNHLAEGAAVDTSSQQQNTRSCDTEDDGQQRNPQADPADVGASPDRDVSKHSGGESGKSTAIINDELIPTSKVSDSGMSVAEAGERLSAAIDAASQAAAAVAAGISQGDSRGAGT